MSIFWTDSDRNVSKTFFHPNSSMNEVQRQIYHLLHCEGHYDGIAQDGKLTIKCQECKYETNEIGKVIVRSVTFAPFDSGNLDSN